MLIKIGLWANLSTPVVGSVTYGGVACTELVTHVPAAADSFFAAIYYIKEASLPANGANDAVVTWSNIDTFTNEKAVVVGCRSGVEQTTTWRDNDETGGASGTAPSLTLTTVAGDWVEACLGQYTGTPSTSDTEDTHAVGAGGFMDCYSSHEVATGTSATVAWTITSQEHAFVAGTLIAESAGGGGPEAGSGGWGWPRWLGTTVDAVGGAAQSGLYYIIRRRREGKPH